MRRLMQWSASHPLLALGVLILGTLVALPGIFRVRLDPSMEGMMIRGGPEHQTYRETLDRFGTDWVATVFVRDRNLFTPEKLGALLALIERLGELEAVERIESLFSVLKLERSPEGWIAAAPMVAWLPETREEAYRIRHAAVNDPILVNHLVSPDGTATAVNVFLDPRRLGPGAETAISETIDRIIAPDVDRFHEIFQLGVPYVNRTLSRGILNDAFRLIPLSVCVLLVVLGALVRSPSATMLPLLTAGTSVLWTLGFLGATGIPINVLTTIVPALLFVIGSTEDIHILWAYREGRRQPGPAASALAHAIEKTGTVITLTALTTFLGFFATTVNKIELLRQFGIVASFGMLVNPLITCLGAPVYLRFLQPFSRRRAPGGRAGRLAAFRSGAVGWLVSTATRRRKDVLRLLLGFMLVLGAFALRVEVDNDPLATFRESSGLVQRSRTLHERLTGSQVFQIRVSGGFPGAFLRPENLKQVEAIQRHLRETGDFDSSVSLADYVATLHRVRNDDNPAAQRVPDDEEQVAEYVGALQADWPSRVATRDLAEVLITVTHRMSSSRRFLQAMQELEAFIAESVDPHLLARVTGRSVLMHQAALSMTLGQVQSISLMLLAIWLIMSLLFVNVKVGFLALVPNLFPIFCIFGIMGVLGIPLNVGTAMVAAISIGIAVDNTMHMMVRYNREIRRLNRVDDALSACLRAEIRPVLTTTAGLALGFATLGFSPFLPIAHFGLLSAAVMVLAGLADLLLTPAILAGTQIITLWDVALLSLKREVLEQVDLFRGMSPSQIKKFVLMGRLREAAAGHRIIEQGAQGSEMFLILEGHARVTVADPDTGEERFLHRAGPGSVMGEISLMTSVSRTANVTAEEPLSYITYDRHTIDRVQRHAPRIASRLFRNLSRIMVVRLQEQAEVRGAARAD